jgi:SAM-dependent methyltransferase
MNETQKTNKIRGKYFFDQYLNGRVIDIGAGADLVCSWAERFDIEDGDANYITKYRESGSYDSVHSSHCLEHMYNPKEALEEWWKLVKPGGYLVIIVPDEDLYEQGIWPSRFNTDHKNTFTLKTGLSWSPVSHNIEVLIKSLPEAEIISAVIHDQHYDYDLQFNSGMLIGKEPRLIRFFRRNLIKILPRSCFQLKKLQEYPFRHFNVPFDQTSRNALAQIQVVAKKLK